MRHRSPSNNVAASHKNRPRCSGAKILENRVPDRIGKYVIINEVGRGSTGTVYLSHDSYYGRDVAIKVYNMDPDQSDERAKIARKMFLSEAHMVGMLQHPHILPIYDAGEENGRCYIVTEHVHGARTLSAYCRPDNLLRIDDVVEIMFKCAKALHYAHTRGVIHRDIKPSNIMLTQDSDVRIIDFGIALVADSEISRIEGIAGSPSYMSPEQVQSLELTHHSDLYSLGAVMYELLTGIRPFRAGNLRQAAAPDRLRHAAADPHAAQGHPRGARGNRRDGDAEDAGQAPQVGRRFRRRAHARAPAPARAERAHRPAGAVRRAAPPALLPRVLARRDLGGAARQHHGRTTPAGEEIVKEGEMDDRFYILVSGKCAVERHGKTLGSMDAGDCFGETSYVRGARRTATIRAETAVSVLRVSSTLLEQVSAACQLRFNRVFLRALVSRLQGNEPAVE